MHDTLCSVILYILAGEHSQSSVQSTVLTFLAKEFQKAEDVFVWINMDDEDLPEDRKARFPVHLAKLTELDTAKGSIGFNWYARSHNVNRQSGFARGDARFTECYYGKRTEDKPWSEANWPAKDALPVRIVIKKAATSQVWVTAESMEELRAYCLGHGPDRSNTPMGKRKRS